MSFFKKILFIAFTVFVIAFVAISLYLQSHGKLLIEEKVSAALKREVHIKEARVLFPLGIRLDGVEIKDTLTAQSMRVKFGFPLYIGGHFNISKVQLKDPEIFISKNEGKSIVLGKVAAGAPVSPGSPPATVVPSAPTPHPSIHQGIVIDYLEVDNGRIHFWDDPLKAEIIFGQVMLKALAVTLPKRNINSKFDISGKVITENIPFSGRKFEARGMINLVALDMDASFKISGEDGASGFSARVKSVNNNMAIKGKINVEKFISDVRTKDSKESSLEGLLANALHSSGIEIGLDFDCHTKMNDIHCGDSALLWKGNIVQTEPKP